MKKIALILLSALAGSFGGLNAKIIPSVKSVPNNSGFKVGMGRSPKGQLRATKPKPSNAAQLKREAKKRNNIRKRK